jgi:acetyl-CoA carboxylase biotin carboxyl carrier protein
MAERNLSYQDLVQIVELIKSTSHFSEFRLKVGDIEVSLRRSNGSVPPVQGSSPQVPVSSKETQERQFPPGTHLVRAPMVGTFYRAPQPGAPPFVQEGDTVAPGQTLCILEAMKLMNEVKADVEATVSSIAVENGEAVEYGQLLFELETVLGRPLDAL